MTKWGLATAALLAAGSAHAATVSYTAHATASGSGGDQVGIIGPGDQPQIPLFDSALGELTGLQIDADIDWQYIATFTPIPGINPPPAPYSVTATVSGGGRVGISRNGAGPQLPSFTYSGSQTQEGVGTGAAGFGFSIDDHLSLTCAGPVPPSTQACGAPLDFLSNGNPFIDPAVPAVVQLFGFPTISFVGTFPPGTGRLSTSFTENAAVTVTYTYTPAGAVPEPATWAMMLGGFGMAGAALRKRKRSAFSCA